MRNVSIISFGYLPLFQNPILHRTDILDVCCLPQVFGTATQLCIIIRLLSFSKPVAMLIIWRKFHFSLEIVLSFSAALSSSGSEWTTDKKSARGLQSVPCCAPGLLWQGLACVQNLAKCGVWAVYSVYYIYTLHCTTGSRQIGLRTVGPNVRSPTVRCKKWTVITAMLSEHVHKKIGI